MKKNFLFSCLLVYALNLFTQNNSIPHLQKQGTATQLIVNNKAFLMLCGELHNSSTSGAAYMRPIWQMMAEKNLNTVVAPVSWELIERTRVSALYVNRPIEAFTFCDFDATMTSCPFRLSASNWLSAKSQLNSRSRSRCWYAFSRRFASSDLDFVSAASSSTSYFFGMNCIVNL